MFQKQKNKKTKKSYQIIFLVGMEGKGAQEDMVCGQEHLSEMGSLLEESYCSLEGSKCFYFLKKKKTKLLFSKNEQSMS